jgi:eukaryotic-like serine/threonine-protein kinase
MTLESGSKLGPYEIIAPIGAGGMGEVYRAHDARVGRDVAIKISAEQFNERFEREIRAVASLNHSNICILHDVGPNYLVMEMVEGPTLADRINQGAIPLEESLEIARQIADALEAAHEKGIVHRDLKPANIKIRPDGTVKVLDFGLAKVGGTPTVSSDNSPTLSVAQTAAGVILGTAAYMSPEQAKGKIVDKRADIWAFGVVLYEMLTGKQLFAGETVSDILASVLKEEPDWEQVPAKVRPLLRRCMEKDPTRRLRDIGEFAAWLEIAPESAPVRRPWLAWSVAVGCLLAALALAAVAYLKRIPVDTRTTRFLVYPPEKWSVALNAGVPVPTAPMAVSPDGLRIAFVGRNTGGKSLLWIRSLDTLTAQQLSGTDGAVCPFWSPDSRFLGFFADGKLKKIEVSGGPPNTLCAAADIVGGTWSRDGVIVYARRGKPLQKVSEAGGASTALTVLGQGEITHAWPFFLPDGRHFLYRASPSDTGGGPVWLAAIDSDERKLLFNADSGNVCYAQGHLFFLRDRALMAQPFDARQLEMAGDAFTIDGKILTANAAGWPYGVFAASENGVLAYQTGMASLGAQFTWFDRTGKQIGLLGDPAGYSDVRLSPDGKQASAIIKPDIWIYNVERGLRTLYTPDHKDATRAIWSHDGLRLVFDAAAPKEQRFLCQKDSNGTGAEEALLKDESIKIPSGLSPDGRSLLYVSRGSAADFDLLILPLSGDRKPFPFIKTPYNELAGRFSPDGEWVAYQSNESGDYEVYVAPFPATGLKVRISTHGGFWPVWRGDGMEIFYLAPDNRMMAAAVNGKGASFDVSAVKPLFQPPSIYVNGPLRQYDVSADGQRFLLAVPVEQAVSLPITVVLNWTAALKK